MRFGKLFFLGAVVLGLTRASTPAAPVPKGVAHADAAATARQREAFGAASDPDKDCSLTFGPRGVSIGLPAQSHLRGLAAGPDNAPRTTRAVGGDFDAAVTVSVRRPRTLWGAGKGRVGGGLLLTNGWNVSAAVGLYDTFVGDDTVALNFGFESEFRDADESAVARGEYDYSEPSQVVKAWGPGHDVVSRPG